MVVRRRQFDRDFKLSAVRMLAGSEEPLVQVARHLGVHESMLRRWRRQVELRGPESFDRCGRQADSEVERLRRENRRLKRDVEMVKKTLVSLERLGR
jgi:transposase